MHELNKLLLETCTAESMCAQTRNLHDDNTPGPLTLISPPRLTPSDTQQGRRENVRIRVRNSPGTILRLSRFCEPMLCKRTADVKTASSHIYHTPLPATHSPHDQQDSALHQSTGTISTKAHLYTDHLRDLSYLSLFRN